MKQTKLNTNNQKPDIEIMLEIPQNDQDQAGKQYFRN